MLRWLKCLFGSHDFHMIGRVASATGHFGCRRCRKEWGVHFNYPVAMLPWKQCKMLADSFGYQRPDKAV